MNHGDWMRLAIHAAQNSQQPVKCGVAVVKDDEILVTTYNQQRELHDATAHAEILAIREVGRLLKDTRLSGCSFYCTCEPCDMCLASISYTKVDDIYVAAEMDVVTQDTERITIFGVEFLKLLSRKIHL